MHICKYNIFIKYRNATPKKMFSSDYFTNIISPFKYFSIKPILDTPYNKNNFNICSPDNQMRFNSPMNSKKHIIIFLFRFYVFWEKNI